MNYKLLIILFIFITGCTDCSKSGRKQKFNKSQSTENTVNNERNTDISDRGSSNVIKMKKINGVYQIPVKVNGTEMYFIFDTGASTISISLTEANFLYKQGKLSDSDVKGTRNFIDATGNISEGTVINLKEVKIGNKVLKNVEASVVNNLVAPLLLGQSALAKFGKVSIDYDKGTITFE